MIVSNFVTERYMELKNQGETEGFLDEKHFGEMKTFINKKPQNVFLQFNFDDDIVYIGS